jgi:hypothetical protein
LQKGGFSTSGWITIEIIYFFPFAIPSTSDAEVVGLKPYSLNDILHILKELEYTLLIILHPKGYYFIYCLHTCLLIGFVPPMFNAQIFIEDF